MVTFHRVIALCKVEITFLIIALLEITVSRNHIEINLQHGMIVGIECYVLLVWPCGHSHCCLLNDWTCNSMNGYTMETNHYYMLHTKDRVMMLSFLACNHSHCCFLNEWTCNRVKDIIQWLVLLLADIASLDIDCAEIRMGN